MKSTLNSFLIFAAGAAIGSAVTWKLVKTKYERIAQEEIDSVKETFANREKKSDVDKHSKDVNHDMQNVRKTYSNMISELDYDAESKEVTYVNKPKVIAPEDFGENDDYDVVSLIYYADNVLTDDMNRLVEDVEGTVGSDFAKHFGEYEEDSVFIRNDDLMTDYEILADCRKYSDVVTINPHRAEEE